MLYSCVCGVICSELGIFRPGSHLLRIAASQGFVSRMHPRQRLPLASTPVPRHALALGPAEEVPSPEMDPASVCQLVFQSLQVGECQPHEGMVEVHFAFCLVFDGVADWL